ncbi:UNVERIFIED_CONTAM: MLO-like protein 11 [Sesamum radiatum]|uniref:MLO-like protein n=1 Tax=Sesamum radiatum TaxID=300843 RepID=A0AAW2K3M5_SESRA
MSESKSLGMSGNNKELRSLALTPTWSVATVLTIFVAVSLLVERSIHRLGNWLKKTDRKPLLAAVEKMKEELMLLGFISLLLTATSSIISNICIPSKFYDSAFAPCTKKEVDEERENNSFKERRLFMAFFDPQMHRRILMGLNQNTCPEASEFIWNIMRLEQLHRFIFVMAVTHISYSCLTMLLAIVKIHSWRAWEDEAHMDRHNSLSEITKALTMQRQSTFVRVHTSNPMDRNSFLVWVTCFFRQFGRSVVRADYLTLRQGFITNHNLTSKYDFHSYMIRSMEEEFQRIVGVSAPLWGFVVAFMLFNVKGSNLYFWIALIPVTNAFELASFFWFWWQFGYSSCFIRNHFLVYLRLIVGFAGQFLCSYSTLPLYALVTQMGTNYKAALIPKRIRETIHGWGKAARRRRRLGIFTDDSTIHTDTSTVVSVEEYDHNYLDSPRFAPQPGAQIELQPTTIDINDDLSVANETSSRVGTPLLRPSASISSVVAKRILPEMISRSSSMPR